MLPRESQGFRPIGLSSSPDTPIFPKTLGLFREGQQLGVREGTDQHKEEDEGHDIGHVGHRLQDDTDDPGQGLHCHAHMH